LKLFGDINRQAKQEKPQRCYTDDFKAQAVTLTSSIGQAQAARKLGMPVKTLSHWVEADRQFAVASDRPAWVGDITTLPTQEGWLYLAVVIDLQTRQVLGYSVSERMPDDWVCQALLNAWTNTPAPARGVSVPL
jgi:transposase InsO family protein